jgi:hypothetical protein
MTMTLGFVAVFAMVDVQDAQTRVNKMRQMAFNDNSNIVIFNDKLRAV